MINLANTLQIVVQVIIVVVIPVMVTLIPTIKKQIEATIGKNNYEFAEAFVKNAVHFVDQTHPELAGDKKYIIAFEAINAKLGNIFTAAEIDQLIESAVKQMNISIAVNTPVTTETPTA